MKQLSVGVSDFKTVRGNDLYYIDRSLFIEKILGKNRNGVYLFTGPHRFGKSLNLSMFDAFLNIRYKGNTWFDGLEISEHSEFDRYRNAFPVIYLNFRSEVRNYDGFLRAFNEKIREIFGEFLYILDSPKLTERDKRIFTDLYNGLGSEGDLQYALKNLTVLLRDYHDVGVVVLIDDYDCVMNKILSKSDCRKIAMFLGEAFLSLFKGNRSLQLGIVIGTEFIENIFCETNNITLNDIFESEFSGMFGFTEEDVKQICADYNHPEKFGEVMEYYDGYRFGDTDIYNPSSILNYVQRTEFLSK